MSASSAERQVAVVEGYRKVLLACCEQERYADFEHLKRQIDSFEDDRGKLLHLVRINIIWPLS